jgi:hypothetical protein
MTVHFIPGGKLEILPEAPRKDGRGTFPETLQISVGEAYIRLAPEQVRGLIAKISEVPELRAYAGKGDQ